MHNVWLIARREYLERVRTRGFVITTIMIPVVMLGFLVGSIVLGAHENMDRRIVVVSQDLPLAEAVQSALQSAPHTANAAQPTSGRFNLRAATKPLKFTVDVMEPAAGTRDLLDHDLDSNKLDGYI